MDSQSFDYWLAQGNYLPPHQTQVFELPADLSQVPSLSNSPVSATFDSLPQQHPHQLYQQQYPHMADELNFSYQLPMTPSDFGSADESPYCSPRPRQTELSYPPPQPAERTHTTSGRRRAQNRAAQRAFRERKEKHAKDLEAQLAVLTEKYRHLESSHGELNAAYDKLRKTIELLTADDSESVGGGAEGEKQGELGGQQRKPSNADTLRKLLDILHGEVRVKSET
ncbi:uncharacterized protein BDZ99DRAFT_110337 [Mytilinidion resinicola]|uniref:BZIP domain-containing protein n=1 Tax=Mytilinidion resinicola TaxID=574789 RepID=A0A6A6YAJ3_9PEZI|nr:uncharacterized protein BDZ99DRAFT_110337 [Mytilinidion resinicola]KAF2805720.1 hypothetical protein BDZ99DRAFT_110337 [Mytilinidion resinicola]